MIPRSVTTNLVGNGVRSADSSSSTHKHQERQDDDEPAIDDENSMIFREAYSQEAALGLNRNLVGHHNLAR